MKLKKINTDEVKSKQQYVVKFFSGGEYYIGTAIDEYYIPGLHLAKLDELCIVIEYNDVYHQLHIFHEIYEIMED